MVKYVILYLAIQVNLITLVPDKGIPETRSKVAIIDTGIQLNQIRSVSKYLCIGNSHYDLTNSGIRDESRHGTNILGIIIDGMDYKNYCIMLIKYHRPTEQNKNTVRLTKALEIINKIDNVRVVNLSSSGFGIFKKERTEMQRLLNKGIHINVSAGNDATNLNEECDIYPACYKFNNKLYNVVGSGMDELSKHTYSNYGSKVVTQWRNGFGVTALGIRMSGTSQACALFTRDLVQKKP